MSFESVEIIKRYELARQLVSSLSKKRLELIDNCLIQDVTPPDFLYGEICLVKAYRECQDLCDMNGEIYPYDEVLSEGVAKGIYCQNCMDAFNIKHNDLSDAKQEFGKAKRAMSCIGKKLLKAV